MTITIDGPRAIALLEAAVAERGEDYQYPSGPCVYVIDDQPACLIGTALNKAGVEVEVLRVLDGAPSDMAYDTTPDGETVYVTGSGIDELAITGFLANEADVVLTREAQRAFSEAQKAQDGHTLGLGQRLSWGKALELARLEVLPR